MIKYGINAALRLILKSVGCIVAIPSKVDDVDCHKVQPIGFQLLPKNIFYFTSKINKQQIGFPFVTFLGLYLTFEYIFGRRN